MLADASGVEAIHLAQPAPEPNRIVRKDDVLYGEIERPDTSGKPYTLGQAPSSMTSVNPQTGQVAEAIESGDGVKRALMRSYLASLDPRESGRVTGSSIKAAMKAMRVNVSEREARRVLDEWKAARNGSA
jgi:hypothetical protein